MEKSHILGSLQGKLGVNMTPFADFQVPMLGHPVWTAP